jgi:hypothetical protein
VKALRSVPVKLVLALVEVLLEVVVVLLLAIGGKVTEDACGICSSGLIRCSRQVSSLACISRDVASLEGCRQSRADACGMR